MHMSLRAGLSTLAVAAITAALPIGSAHAAPGHLTLIARIHNGTHSCSFTRSVSDLDNAYTGCSMSDDAFQVSNYDSVAWVVYDDKRYRDRHYCVRPGRLNVNLSDKHMSSKVSSIKKLSTASCAGYTQL